MVQDVTVSFSLQLGYHSIAHLLFRFSIFTSFSLPLAANFSVAPMRAEGGYKVILEAIEKLGKKHAEHIKVYGEGNEKRLTGKHETASMHHFSFGVANRGASIRIPRETERDGKGYLEDRRPASNCDAYIVTSKIYQTTCLE
jgi:glutamine synthetase